MSSTFDRNSKHEKSLKQIEKIRILLSTVSSHGTVSVFAKGIVSVALHLAIITLLLQLS